MWFTKWLFYSLLLKICIGLSLLFSSFVLGMFCKCFWLPRGRHLSPNTSNSRSSDSCLCLEERNRCTDNKVSLHFFLSSFLFSSLSDMYVSELTHHLKDEHKCTFLLQESI
ncbi:hypothetical protein ILYODFUR_002338 [Ilyodon furcidens]|uniref:Secreted protein n=1 Tax=Ilyodon furcidens TaxID=33524 RepID=A0ABV0UZJ9_9TELE